jgi:putative tryptophan/tyrosine transport system substrate-binding protein
MRLIGLAVMLAVSLILAPLAAEARQAGKVARIGDLGTSASANGESFRQGMRDLGHVEGRNVVIEYRGDVTELVALKVDVIVTSGTLQTLAAKRATTTLHIVFTAVGDPVASGFVTSLRRPGGNATGLSTLAVELVGKCLEQLKQAVPGVSRVSVLRDESPGKLLLEQAEVAARALGVQLQVVEARDPAEFDRAFSDMARARAGALMVLPTPMLFSERRRLVDLAAKNRLPAVFPYREFVDAGGLMAYGPNLADLSRRGALPTWTRF